MTADPSLDAQWAAYHTQQQQAQQGYANGYATAPAPQVPAQGISMLGFGHPKQGKSTWADVGATAVGPCCIVDVEGTSRWTPTRKTYWDPTRQTVPQPPGDHLTAGYGQPSITPAWESCIGLVRDYQDAFAIRKVLDSGNHPFNSLDMDGVSEFQMRVAESLAGTRKLEWDDWGKLLRNVSSLVRGFRDLVNHPTRKMWVVTMTAMAEWDTKTSKWRPLLQGASSRYVPYVPDLMGWIEQDAGSGQSYMMVGRHPQYETGSRFGERLPYSLPLAYPGHPGWTAADILTQVLTAETR